MATAHEIQTVKREFERSVFYNATEIDPEDQMSPDDWKTFAKGWLFAKLDSLEEARRIAQELSTELFEIE